MFVYTDGDDELTIEQDSQYFEGYGKRVWNKNWRFKDSNGHWHHYGDESDEFPTLLSREKIDWDYDDEPYSATEYFCPECNEVVEPKTTTEYTKGRVITNTRYILKTVKQITAEEAEAWIRARQLPR